MIDRILRTAVTTLIIMLTFTVFNGGRVVDWYMWVVNWLMVTVLAVLIGLALKR